MPCRILPESPRWLLVKGKVEEAKHVLRYAADMNKTTIPLSLLDKVRGLGPSVGQGWELWKGLFPPHPFRGGLGPEGVSSPLLEGNSDSKIKSRQGKTRDQAGTVGAGPCGSSRGGSKLGSPPCLWLVLFVL